MPKREPMIVPVLRRPLGRRRLPVDACSDSRLQCGRHTDVGDFKLPAVCAAFTDNHLAFGELPNDLLNIERVSGSWFDDVRGELMHRRMRPDELGSHFPRR